MESSCKQEVNPCSTILCNNRMPEIEIDETRAMISCTSCNNKVGPFFKNVQYSSDGLAAVTSVWNARNVIKPDRYAVLSNEDEKNENFSNFEKILDNRNMIVVRLDDQKYWKADDFFYSTDIRGFTIETI